MVPFSQWLLFSGTALLLAVTPGPNMIYLVSRSISQGWRAAVVSLFGVVAAFLLHMTAAALGLTALFLAVPIAYEALKWAGALYLFWLAWQALKPGARSLFEPRLLPAHSSATLFRMGFLTCALNPKAAMLYLSILPQFVSPANGPVLAQSLVLGTTQIFISFSCNLVVALSAAGISGWFARKPAWMSTQRYFMGSVLGALAVRMVLERRTA